LFLPSSWWSHPLSIFLHHLLLCIYLQHGLEFRRLHALHDSKPTLALFLTSRLVDVAALMFHFHQRLVILNGREFFWSTLVYSFSGFLAFVSLLSDFNTERGHLLKTLLEYCVSGPFGPVYPGRDLMIVNATRQATSDDEKSRLRYILIFTAVGVVTGLTDLVQLLKVPIPPLGISAVSLIRPSWP